MLIVYLHSVVISSSTLLHKPPAFFSLERLFAPIPFAKSSCISFLLSFLVSEITYYHVSIGTLNPTHQLPHSNESFKTLVFAWMCITLLHGCTGIRSHSGIHLQLRSLSTERNWLSKLHTSTE